MNALEYAIKMEKDGEEYYRKQAVLNKKNSLNTVCLILANDESVHASILYNKMNGMQYDFVSTDIYSVMENIFSDVENFKSEFKETPSQLDFYQMAMEKEQQSINLYVDLLSKALNDEEKLIFDFLIKQEKEHYNVLDELSFLLRRPDEWVESAEFGIREEY